MSKSKIKFDKVTDKSVKISWDSPKVEEKAIPIKKYVIEKCIADNYEVWEKVGLLWCFLVIYNKIRHCGYAVFLLNKQSLPLLKEIK